MLKTSNCSPMTWARRRVFDVWINISISQSSQGDEIYGYSKLQISQTAYSKYIVLTCLQRNLNNNVDRTLTCLTPPNHPPPQRNQICTPTRSPTNALQGTNLQVSNPQHYPRAGSELLSHLVVNWFEPVQHRYAINPSPQW